MEIHAWTLESNQKATRLIVQGGPDLGSGTLAERREVFHKQFDHVRSALCNEPRGSDAVVGALLCEPHEPGCAAGVIFFNNVGVLGMCGHGTIGLLATLAWMGRVQPGIHRIDTPVGVVEATLQGANQVSLRNVASYRLHRQVALNVPGHGIVHGDVAWGGNWFFLVDDHGLDLSLRQVGELTSLGTRIRHALQGAGITGADGAEIDHVVSFGVDRDVIAIVNHTESIEANKRNEVTASIVVEHEAVVSHRALLILIHRKANAEVTGKVNIAEAFLKGDEWIEFTTTMTLEHVALTRWDVER